MIDEHVVRRDIAHATGHRYTDLEKEVGKLSPAALRDFHRLMQDVDWKIRDAERHVRMWPGGPRIRM